MLFRIWYTITSMQRVSRMPLFQQLHNACRRNNGKFLDKVHLYSFHLSRLPLDRLGTRALIFSGILDDILLKKREEDEGKGQKLEGKKERLRADGYTCQVTRGLSSSSSPLRACSFFSGSLEFENCE